MRALEPVTMSDNNAAFSSSSISFRASPFCCRLLTMAVRDKARKAMWKECDTVTVETQVVTPKVVLDLDLWNTSSQCKKQKTKNVCFCSKSEKHERDASKKHFSERKRRS